MIWAHAGVAVLAVVGIVAGIGAEQPLGALWAFTALILAAHHIYRDAREG